MKFVAHGFISLFALCLLPSCASARESLQGRVSNLVDQTTRSEKAARRAFSELESLGNQAVPYMVGHLGDVRPLVAQEISLENRASDSFEGVRHYGPKTVHDALAAILNQITGKSFVIVYNGATPQDREDNHSKWIEWCRMKFPEQSEICNGG